MSRDVEMQQTTMPKITPGDAQTNPVGTQIKLKNMVEENMIVDELWGAKGAPIGPQMDHFRCQNMLKAHQGIVRKSVSKKLQVLYQKHTNWTPTLVHGITTHDANKLQRNMSRQL